MLFAVPPNRQNVQAKIRQSNNDKSWVSTPLPSPELWGLVPFSMFSTTAPKVHELMLKPLSLMRWLPKHIFGSFSYFFQLIHSWYQTFNASIYSASFDFLLCPTLLSIVPLERIFWMLCKILIADVLIKIGILMPNGGYWSKFVSCCTKSKRQ